MIYQKTIELCFLLHQRTKIRISKKFKKSVMISKKIEKFVL